jgi:hypothetical protein
MSEQFFRNVKLLLRGNASVMDSAGENLIGKCSVCKKQYASNEIVNTIKEYKVKVDICFNCLIKMNNE